MVGTPTAFEKSTTRLVAVDDLGASQVLVRGADAARRSCRWHLCAATPFAVSNRCRHLLRGDPSPRYRIRWDDGHESIYTPASGALRAEPGPRRGSDKWPHGNVHPAEIGVRSEQFIDGARQPCGSSTARSATTSPGRGTGISTPSRSPGGPTFLIETRTRSYTRQHVWRTAGAARLFTAGIPILVTAAPGSRMRPEDGVNVCGRDELPSFLRECRVDCHRPLARVPSRPRAGLSALTTAASAGARRASTEDLALRPSDENHPTHRSLGYRPQSP